MNKLLAVVGMSGTGKSVITEYLEENNYTSNTYKHYGQVHQARVTGSPTDWRTKSLLSVKDQPQYRHT